MTKEFSIPVPPHIHIDTRQSASEAAIAMGERITQEIGKAKAKGKGVFLLLAGGGAIQAYETVDTSLLGGNDIFGMADDRISTIPGENNAASFTQTEFFKRAASQGAQFFDTQVQGWESADMYARRLNDEVLRAAEGRKIILVLGLGGQNNAEGHVAGIMPFSHPSQNYEAYSSLYGPTSSSDVFVSYDSKGVLPPNLRGTITPNFMANMMGEEDVTLLLTSTSKKADAVKMCFDPMGSIQRVPGRIIQIMRGSVYLFLDKEASAKIYK